MMANEISFKQTLFIKSTKKEVWNALVEPEIVKRYFLCPLKKIGLKENSPIIYGNKEFDLIIGRIISCDKNRKLVHSFKFLPPGHEGTDKDEETIVSYCIEEENGLVILTLLHEGFIEKNQSYQNITGGWPFILSNLKTMLETGKTLYE